MSSGGTTVSVPVTTCTHMYQKQNSLCSTVVFYENRTNHDSYQGGKCEQKNIQVNKKSFQRWYIFVILIFIYICKHVVITDIIISLVSGRHNASLHTVSSPLLPLSTPHLESI